MTDVIRVGDDVTGSPLPGPLHAVAVKKVGGDEYQIVTTGPFPEVPGATQCNITFPGGNPTVFTFFDPLGNLLATKTITWVGGNPTSQVWT